ncbi:ATP-binding protein [Streptomyces viridochromogenes]|uniref:Putative AfsR-like regulator n=1 Tax=Streptomyces viridochromogenes Tue57 TaxID=1160705 RepID=L8PG45_STRVR|nr:tetratricopeptide repeat protein [Streptomyces viridochromogenes]ELS56536.1 putative AfsR-like regulator [Streptomyces viridochromogenes Tue57]
MLIFAVTGMGGIGKTALAVEAAHRACAAGWFPGGTLFVDLRGYDDDPVTADQAVLALLDAMGVRGAELPQAASRQHDAYRELLAERQDRTLLILDNVSDPSQFLPLLPGTDHHRVLITSRDRPDALPVRLIDLETLAPDDSAALVTRALLAADERDDRPAREPRPLLELTELCGHLPLALQIAAAMLRRRRQRGIAALVAEIRRVGDALAVLDNGSRGTDQYGRSLALRPVVATSYRRLPPDQARLLRLVALAPGAETGSEAVAALTDLDVAAATGLLEDLAAAGLVTAVPTGGEVRWRLHDLVRAFGAGLVAGDAGLREEGEQARERLLGFYRRWAHAADDRLRWLPGKPEPERFEDREQALAWLDGERAGLVASVQWAGEERYAHTAVRLAVNLAEYLDWRRYFDDWITVARAAREAAHRVGDDEAEAIAETILGNALQEAGRTEEAIDAHTRARDLYESAGDRHGEAIARNNLGNALQHAGRTEEAIVAFTRARDLFQAAGDRHGEATPWNGLGNALLMAGRTEEAIDAHTRARDLSRSAGDRHGEAIAWSNLGIALWHADRVAEATEAYDKALVTYLEFEDWYGAGQALYNLALVHRAVLHPAEARAHYLRAAEAFTRANAPTEAAEAQSAAQTLT